MKKLFLLIALATSISSQSFAAFEKDAEGDYVLWSEDGQKTDLLGWIAGKNTVINDVAEDGHKYTISVQIMPRDLDRLAVAFDTEGGILMVTKTDRLVERDVAGVQEYEVYTSLSDDVIALTLSERQIHQ
jgi:hypothetical protein